MDTDAGGGECGRVGVVVGVTFDAIRQYSSKLSIAKHLTRTDNHLQANALTFFNAFPEPILICLAQTGHTLRISPSQEISLFKLTHESLFARVDAWR